MGTKADKESILNRGGLIREWFDLYGYGDLETSNELSFVSNNDPSSIVSNNDPGTIYAVINTPKMATGTLQGTFIKSLKCKKGEDLQGVRVHDCGRDQKVIRSHDFHKAVPYIQQH